jgi:hypothetical protein
MKFLITLVLSEGVLGRCNNGMEASEWCGRLDRVKGFVEGIDEMRIVTGVECFAGILTEEINRRADISV